MTFIWQEMYSQNSSLPMSKIGFYIRLRLFLNVRQLQITNIRKKREETKIICNDIINSVLNDGYFIKNCLPLPKKPFYYTLNDEYLLSSIDQNIFIFMSFTW